MKQLNIKTIIILVIISLATFVSCVEEDVHNQENEVTIKVLSNTPDAIISIDYPKELRVKSGWKYSYKTLDYLIRYSLRCKDSDVLISTEVYINGKLRVKDEGNSYLRVECQIKGDAPL
ncbi:MAG: hypothetical protein ACK5L5_06225 [Bacteroidales bacterium]